MKRLLTAAILATLPAAATAEPVIVQTTGSVAETVERLKASVEAAGGRVFAVVDFGGGIRSIGEDVGEVQLLIFGDPRIGARALSADRMAALDLPGARTAQVAAVNRSPSSRAACARGSCRRCRAAARWDAPGPADQARGST
jgi:hypothetical protein